MTNGVLALLGGLFVGWCSFMLIDATSGSPSWLLPFAVAVAAAYGPILFVLGAWCLSLRSSSIYAAVAIPLLWIAQGTFLWFALPSLGSAIVDHPLYVGLTMQILKAGLQLGLVPAFVALPVAAVAAFFEWRIRRCRFELSESVRLSAAANSTI